MYLFFNLINSESIAVSVITYNRIDYLKKTLTSIEKNKEAQTLPFYFFIDGGPFSKQDEIEKLINNSKIKNKKVIKRQQNLGISLNIIESRKHILNNLNYDYLIEIEDDTLITPQYFSLIINLNKWAQKNLSNIAGVMCFHVCNMSKLEKLKNLNKVHLTIGHRGMMIGKKYWDLCKKHFNLYYDFIKKNKSHYKALDLLHSFLLNKNFENHNLFNKNILNEIIIPRIKNHTWSGYPDGATQFIFSLNDLFILTTTVNRLLDIGEEGENINKESYMKMYESVSLDEFEQDLNILEFEF